MTGLRTVRFASGQPFLDSDKNSRFECLHDIVSVGICEGVSPLRESKPVLTDCNDAVVPELTFDHRMEPFDWGHHHVEWNCCCGFIHSKASSRNNDPLIVSRGKGAVVQPEPLRRVDTRKLEAVNLRVSRRPQSMPCDFCLHGPWCIQSRRSHVSALSCSPCLPTPGSPGRHSP